MALFAFQLRMRELYRRVAKTAISGRKGHTSLFRKNPLHKFPSLELTHNHKTWALKQVNPLVRCAALTQEFLVYSPCQWWVCHFRGDKFSVFGILNLNNDVLSQD